MKNTVHPTAIIEDGARIGAGVTVGPFSLIGNNVTLADGVVVDARVIIRGRTTIGERTRISAHAYIGGEPQDLSYRGEDTAIEIGADCIIRENATIHRGTAHGRGMTSIGNHVFMMVGSHVAHDCVVGDHVILTNNALLGGHSQIGDYAILGGAAAVQQRTRIGAHCFIGGLTGVERDVVPYAMAVGQHAEIAGINVRGLKRRGFDLPAILALRAAFRMFFNAHGPRAERIAAVEEAFGGVAAVGPLLDFLRAAGEKPLTLPRKAGWAHDDDLDA
jgi:UDP-N-acetylglucosamine acyltransferase